MASQTSYHLGGYQPAAAAQNRSEQWTNATQPTDPTPAGYTAWNSDGTVAATRALTTAESTLLANTDTTNTAIANSTTIQANIQTHLGQIETWLAANPNGAVLTAAQTAQLARMLVGVGRILLALTSTIGQAT